MNSPHLSALSPLDGRYHQKMSALRPVLSELGYMHQRVRVEVAWFMALSDAGFSQFPALSLAARDHLTELVTGFGETSALQIKAIEATTNHDVKAVEYWLTGFERASNDGSKEWVPGQFETGSPEVASELTALRNFVHFACTSEDINNTSHALQLKAALSQVLLPQLDVLIAQLRHMAGAYAQAPMLSRTHGQTASPTTVGKECANVLVRLQTARDRIAAVPLRAKMNGAVGNYSAHLSAWPDHDWEAFSRGVVERDLGLVFQPFSIQIEPHDYMAELFDAIARANTILIDWARDVWGYVSLGYFKQRLKAGEVGSSTMPHKVNPIDFENAEGNLGLANAVLRHLSDKLPISRWQRDLTDSTVLRNMGVAFGYAHLAWQAMATGMGKLELNEHALAADLAQAWEVLGEPVQTVMRKHGLPEPYEQLKAFTRGQPMTQELMQGFVRGLALPEPDKQNLLNLTPASYLGAAAALAARAAQ